MNNEVNIASTVKRIADSFDLKLKKLLANCESQIEQLFLIYLIENLLEDVSGYSHEFLFHINPNYDDPIAGLIDHNYHSLYRDRFGNEIAVYGIRIFGHGLSWTIIPQYKVSTEDTCFRLDFAIKFEREFAKNLFKRNICVECHGHDFHEKSREQAARDKRRSRVLASDGWHTIEYTGSEIYSSSDFNKFQSVMKELHRIIYSTWQP